MTEPHYLPYGDPDEAVFYDLNKRQVTLASGQRVPVLRYMDADGDEVTQCELDLHDHVSLLCGPLNNGLLLMVTVPVNGTGHPYPAVGNPDLHEAATHRSH